MITRIKLFLHSIIYLIWDRSQISRLKRIKSRALVYVVDIDNTLTVSTLGRSVNHKNPVPRSALIKFIVEEWYGNGSVIFLSARDRRLYSQTKMWLEKQALGKVTGENLFLVKSASEKLKYLEILIGNNVEVIYLDDLSFNHENGSILFYDIVIQKLGEMKLKYLGVDFISTFAL